ncbi:hypothetical protein [Micromonospora chersina]|uniref:hypothetical protein n=1 Tax=Micromonospora chersina TaxID=47854 RepID=UPI00371A5E11
MTIDQTIAMNACPDCPADVTVVPSRSGITGKPVPVVTVSHQPTCPWAVRYVGAPLAIAAGEAGIVIHMRAEE